MDQEMRQRIAAQLAKPPDPCRRINWRRTRNASWFLWGDLSRISGDASGIYGRITNSKSRDIWDGGRLCPATWPGLSGNVTELRGNISGIRGDASKILGDTSGLKGIVSYLSGDVTWIWGRIGIYKIYENTYGPDAGPGSFDIVPVLCGNMTGIRGNITGLRGDLSGIQGDVSRIRGDISNIRGDVSGLRGDVSLLKGDVTGIVGNTKEILRTLWMS